VCAISQVTTAQLSGKPYLEYRWPGCVWFSSQSCRRECVRGQPARACRCLALMKVSSWWKHQAAILTWLKPTRHTVYKPGV